MRWPGARNSRTRRQPASLVDRLRRRGENAVARGQNLEAIADAAAPLYATLSEDQKHRLPVLMHGLMPHFFHRHFAMMGDGQEHWGRRGGWDEPEGFAPEDGDRIPGQRSVRILNAGAVRPGLGSTWRRPARFPSSG